MDNCCLNRPSDDQSNPRIHLESEAIKTIIDLVENDTWELFSSVSYLVYPKLKDTVPFNCPLIVSFNFCWLISDTLHIPRKIVNSLALKRHSSTKRLKLTLPFKPVKEATPLEKLYAENDVNGAHQKMLYLSYNKTLNHRRAASWRCIHPIHIVYHY